MNLAEIRKQFPQYDAYSDGELATALHQKYYGNLDFRDFSKRIGYLKGAQPEEYDPESPEYQAKYGATSGMAGWEKFAAGAGKAVTDIGRGLGQFAGLVSREDVDASRAQDAPLMRSGAGLAGNIVGNVAAFFPTALIPGANTIAGAGAIGAATGLLQPVGTQDSRLKNAALGGVLGPAAMVGGRALAAGYRGGKALVEPLTKKGQERIAARTMEAFAGGQRQAIEAAGRIAANRGSILPGVQPTAAELAENAGVAQLERTLRNNPEYLTALTDRSQANKNALLGALDSIAGDDATRAAAVTARGTATRPLYDAAKSADVVADAELGKLLARPSMEKAWARAEALAAETGESLGAGREITGRSLHYLKMAMDDLADAPPAMGIGANEARAIAGTRQKLLEWIEQKIPAYKQARETYSAMSKPINQMDVGRELRNKLQPALADFGAGSRLRPQAFAQALREGDDTAARVLGREQARLADVMTPQQMQTLEGVGKQLARRTNADELGRAVGSNTGQNLVSQNVVRQLLGPFGMSPSRMQSVAESALMQSALRPVQWIGNLGEQRAMGLLAKAALDPDLAEKLLRAGVPPQTVGLLRYQGLLAPGAVSGAYAARQ